MARNLSPWKSESTNQGPPLVWAGTASLTVLPPNPACYRYDSTAGLLKVVPLQHTTRSDGASHLFWVEDKSYALCCSDRTEIQTSVSPHSFTAGLVPIQKVEPAGWSGQTWHTAQQTGVKWLLHFYSRPSYMLHNSTGIIYLFSGKKRRRTKLQEYKAKPFSRRCF